MLSPAVAQAWIPPDHVSAVDWVPANIIIPEETETPGAFDLDLFPHVRGALELADDPMIRQILFRWSARNAKTTTCLALLAFWACNAPRPMMLGSSNEEKADDTIDSQLYPILEACAATRGQLKPPHQRNGRFVALKRCRIRKSFSGSPSSMAGFPACYAHAGEVSKWTKKKSSEADPIRLFLKRAMLYPYESKYLFESTPGTKGHCSITKLVDDPNTQRRYRFVPCPHCGEYQRLKWGDRDPGSGGVRWDKPTGGHSERGLAIATARYECANCKKPIEDRHRPAMMRAGVWVPEGQSIDKKGKLHGKPKVESPNVALDDLSALYSLAIGGWGQLVGEFLDSRGDRESRRDFINSVLAQVYDPAPVKVRAHDLTERLGSDEPPRLCPLWVVFLTMAVDVQQGGTFFKWQVDGWGQHARGHLVDHGVALGEPALEALIKSMQYPHADGGKPLRPARAFLDARDGHVTELIYAFCRRVPGCFPCMGSSRSAFREMCRPQPIGNVPAFDKIAKSGVVPTHFAAVPIMYEINTHRTQIYVQNHLDGLIKPEDPSRFTLNSEAAVDEELLGELTNEFPHDETNVDGYEVSVWTKLGPNDQRDDWRYNRALADLLAQNGRGWDKLVRLPPNAPAPAPPRRAGLTTPDGRPFLITER